MKQLSVKLDNETAKTLAKCCRESRRKQSDFVRDLILCHGPEFAARIKKAIRK
jgi:hypothetical protein